MRKSPVSHLLCALLVLLPLSGCYKVKARAELQKGNRLYKDEAYKDALAQFQKGLAIDPSVTFAWRSVGLTAMALYKPGNDNPDNLKFAETAIDAFTKYLKDYPDDGKVEEYLVTTWINSGRFDKAIDYLKAQRQAHPENARLNQAIITVMIKAVRYPDALDWANSHARNDASLYYLIATNAWSKSYNDPTTAFEERVKIVDLGLQAVQRAVEIRPEYMEAMVYYNLLYREKAKLDPNEKQKAYWTSLADEWRSKAMALKDRQKGISSSQPAPAKTAS